jgi:hypothetical protein
VVVLKSGWVATRDQVMLKVPILDAVARLRLPTGRHNARLEFLEPAVGVVASETAAIEALDGGFTFFNRRSFS